MFYLLNSGLKKYMKQGATFYPNYYKTHLNICPKFSCQKHFPIFHGNLKSHSLVLPM